MDTRIRYCRNLAVMALSVTAMPATAQCLNEDLKITASDAMGSDEFGVAVGIANSTAIVGARTDDSGTNSGSAYLFNTATGQQLFKLTASDSAGRDQFGTSVAISGDIAIVGAPENDDAGGDSGSAYLFDTTTGQQLFKLTASDAASNDQFGISVGISGTTAIVGAWSNDDAGSSSGSAYIFDTNTGIELFKLMASDAASGDRFGYSVDISGTTAIVGARFDDDAGSSSGSAYLFDTTTGQQLFKLTASDAAAGDRFGAAVAISGSIAVVGAAENDDAGSNSGSAYFFDTLTGQQLFKLTASDAAAGDEFGTSVAISGDYGIVGSYRDDNAGASSGSAYVFDTNTGQQLFKLVASDAAAQDQLGWSVAISEGTALVGALNDDDSGTDSGAAYAYTLTEAEPCLADWNNDCLLNFFDVSAYIMDFSNQQPASDLAPPFGSYNFFDVSAFISAFNAGCD